MIVFAQLIAPSSGKGCLYFLERKRAAGHDTWPGRAQTRRIRVGFRPALPLSRVGGVSMPRGVMPA